MQEVGVFNEALSWANTALGTANQFFKSFNGEERLLAKKLTGLYMHAATLHELSGDIDSAKKIVVEMKIATARFASAPLKF